MKLEYAEDRDIIRNDAREKLSGEARYVDDCSFPSLWHGGVVRSACCRGKIGAVDFDPSFDWSRVAVVVPGDLPGPNEVAVIALDQPILAEKEARFFGEPLVLVAAPEKELLREALGAVRVSMEELPPLADPREALKDLDRVQGESNLFKKYDFSRGDPEGAFEKAARVVEVECTTPHQEQMYLEPQGMLGRPLPGGGVEILGSMQCPYYVHSALCHGLGLPPEKVRVRQTVTGGAFGGKEDYPSVLALHTALLALKSGHPVKMVLDRSEDIRCTTKRHPSRSRFKAGFTEEGRLEVLEADILLDGGAYMTLSPVVLSRAVLHATGCYGVEHVRVQGTVVATNSPPNGAFRGFGAPQILFGLERLMDAAARECGLDFAEIRRRNILQPGDRLPCGQELPHPGASLVLEKALEMSRYEEKRRKPPTMKKGFRWGMGVALFLHGGGFTGSGEEEIAGKIALEISPRGNVEILTSSVEMGQGASTVLAMIASKVLHVPYHRISHGEPDTFRVPNSGPTVASRTTMMVGGILESCCKKLVRHLTALEAERSGGPCSWEEGVFRTSSGETCSLFEMAEHHLPAGKKVFREEAEYIPLEGAGWDDDACRGTAYKDYSWGANVLEVRINEDTLEAEPLLLTSAVDVGAPLHPLLAQGQVEGGSLQALGYGGMEDLGYGEGRYTKDRMGTCLIPTALDTPAMAVFFEGIPFEHGPGGAKGLGELPMNGGAPVLAGAVEDALGISPRNLPVTPARIFELLQKKEENPR